MVYQLGGGGGCILVQKTTHRHHNLEVEWEGIDMCTYMYACHV